MAGPLSNTLKQRFEHGAYSYKVEHYEHDDLVIVGLHGSPKAVVVYKAKNINGGLYDKEFLHSNLTDKSLASALLEFIRMYIPDANYGGLLN